MPNPLQSLIPKDPETGPDPNGMRGKMEMMEKARQALKGGAEAAAPVSGAHATPFTGTVSKPLPAPNPKTQYGTRPGEKRIDTSYPDSPMPKMHSGGTVTQTGPHILKKGEKVLSPEDHGHLKAAMSLAQSALSHDPEKEPEPELPRHLREMHIKELHTGGFHVQKHDGKGGMTEHGAPHNDAVVGHFMDHMSHPDEDEEDVEAGNHDMNGAEAAEKAVGLK